MRAKKIVFATIVGFVLVGPIGACTVAVISVFLTRNKKSSYRESNHDNWNTPDISDLNSLNYSAYKRKEAGDYGEKLMRAKLKELKGNLINGYITTENMIFKGRNFEVDFLVLMPKVGLIVVEVKHYAGEVYCNSDKEWYQISSQNGKKIYKNASLQSLRTTSLLKELLESKYIDKWPLLSVVVFTHPTAKIYKQTGEKRPQTEILKRNMFENWLCEQEQNINISFSTDDFNNIRHLLKSNEHEFSRTKN